MPQPRIPGRIPGDQLFFGRRKGRPLRAGMQALLDTRLPALAVPADVAGDPRGWFGRQMRAAWLEIGFGGGEHLAWQAAANPDVGIVGCEPFMNGVASLLRHLENDRLDNVRILADDARPLAAALPAGSLERIFVLHPDPWPKRRHHFRRLIQHASIARFHELLAPGGELRIATDDPGYLTWILARVTAHPGLRWTGARLADWHARPDDWPETRYEAKARSEGRDPVYMRFQKV
ncbi:tRNA (guanine(46)-N(7))-methyltransferase TrmB [Thalassobaculum sp.]|uniref:tRNA (guanine(46)-N(7))-methyltransferase TrmB n=1 Tax=Thalassobaculum sp. TaxID=2022740 RepID=UPI0032EF6BEC